MQKFKRKRLKKKWSIQRFYNIIKYNTMFYLDIYNIPILFNGWSYEIMFFHRFMNLVKIYNKFFNYYYYHKYIISLKDFFFQLIYENVEYFLIYIIINIQKIKKSMSFNFINEKNKIFNNFIYRKYTFDTWLEYDHFDDLFNDLDFFKDGNYSIKLSKWIIRYFYKKSELYMFFSESLQNKYINKKRLLL